MVDTVDLDTRDGLGLSLEDVARWDLYRLFKNEPMTIVINTKIFFALPKKDSMQCREVGALELEELIRGVRLGLG